MAVGKKVAKRAKSRKRKPKKESVKSRAKKAAKFMARRTKESMRGQAKLVRGITVGMAVPGAMSVDKEGRSDIKHGLKLIKGKKLRLKKKAKKRASKKKKK